MAARVWARDAPTILVVDDDREIRELIAEVLALDGYRVTTAPNGKVALEQAREDPPDVIVLDLMMPVMCGWEFLEALRQDPSLAPIPVIVDTASPDSQVEGAAAILRKPFEVGALLAAASRLCEGGRKPLVSVSEQLST
jgi:CheY-like chemotaxis protein